MAFYGKVKNTYHTQKSPPWWSTKEGPSYINSSGRPKDGAIIKQDTRVSSVFLVQIGLSKFHRKCECVTGFRHFSVSACIGSGSDEADFPHSSPHTAVLHTGSLKGADNTRVFWLLLSGAGTASAMSQQQPLHPQRVSSLGWERT